MCKQVSHTFNFAAVAFDSRISKTKKPIQAMYSANNGDLMPALQLYALYMQARSSQSHLLGRVNMLLNHQTAHRLLLKETRMAGEEVQCLPSAASHRDSNDRLSKSSFFLTLP